MASARQSAETLYTKAAQQYLQCDTKKTQATFFLLKGKREKRAKAKFSSLKIEKDCDRKQMRQGSSESSPAMSTMK